MRTSFWTKLLDVISPRPCVICGERLSANERVICGACHLHLPLTHYEQQPFDNPMARLFWGQFPVERAAALFFYEAQAPVSRIIYDFKYHNRPEVAQNMGIITARQFAAEGFFDGIDALVPMPITWRRRWHRGYNQSHEIARGISEATRIPIYNNVVKRVRFKKSQTKQHAWERLRNVDDAFRLVRPEKISGLHLLLIDDIVTTGATVNACAREIAKANNVRISILSLGLTKS
ncbi:MAG: ComF family protein [Prevotella sp.]|jgi:ComF family protein|nr:ComF family protein [Prevotella sp.]